MKQNRVLLRLAGWALIRDGGLLALVRDPGEANWHPGGLSFETHLQADVIRRGKLADRVDLGSGLVTNVGVLALANDFAWADGCQTLKLANYHATGKGTTPAAATDIALQTLSTQGGQTPVAGTQTLVSGANSQQYKTVATINYTGAEAVTEWGLFTDNVLSVTTGSPLTAAAAATATVTGTPYTPSGPSARGEQQRIIVPSTTAVWGMILSNTTSVLMVPAWYKQSDGTVGATPGATEAFSIKPVMWDHRQFAAFNVENTDSIQFTYTLTVVSGG